MLDGLDTSAGHAPPCDVQRLHAEVVAGVSMLDEAGWNACYPDHAESWQYYRACESGSVDGVYTAAVVVHDGTDLVAAAPLFEMSYRLDTPLQGTVFRSVGNAVARALPVLVEWRLLGVGSPYTDQCHIALRPGLTKPTRDAALSALITEVEAEARRRRASLIAYKDVLATELALTHAPLDVARYVKIPSLPMAVLDIGATSIDGYLATLSPATRKDIRRKVKAASAVRIERRSDIRDIAPTIDALYNSTRLGSAVSYDAFEELPTGYFHSVSERLGDRVMFMLYWVGDELAAFNMLLLEPDRVIDKFLGMRYPLAREHNLYTVSWLENVRYCIEAKRRFLQSGQTAYAAKLRYGSHLVPSALFVKHRNPVFNRVIRWIAPLAAFDRWDPDLRQLARRDKRASSGGQPAVPAGTPSPTLNANVR